MIEPYEKSPAISQIEAADVTISGQKRLQITLTGRDGKETIDLRGSNNPSEPLFHYNTTGN